MENNNKQFSNLSTEELEGIVLMNEKCGKVLVDRSMLFKIREEINNRKLAISTLKK